jgi:UDP-glucose 4-epimerase
MRIIVDGGAGFVGSHLVERLVAQGHGVTVVDDLSNGSLENLEAVKDNVRFLKQDVSHPNVEKWGEADVVYHLACWPRSRSFADPRRDVEVNLIGMVNVLEYARRCGARVVFSSNSGIYDSTVQPIREGNPENPTTPYDVNKLASEHMIKAYAQAYGIKYTIFRFATVYGPRQKVSSEWNPVIANFIQTIHRGGIPYITGHGKQTRDFIYVSDIVDALVKGAEIRSSVGPLLLGSGVETSIMSVLEKVCNILNTSVTFNVRPPPLGEIMRMSYDCSKARNTLGWGPKVSLDEGIANYLKYLLGEG